jgi:hypothetical protein
MQKRFRIPAEDVPGAAPLAGGRAALRVRRHASLRGCAMSADRASFSLGL